jgi:hypothetical protein
VTVGVGHLDPAGQQAGTIISTEHESLGVNDQRIMRRVWVARRVLRRKSGFRKKIHW